MELRELEQLILEEVRKAIAEQARGEETLLPADTNETLDSNACRGPVCSVRSESTPIHAPQPALPAGAASPHTNGPAVLLLFSCAREAWDTLSTAFIRWQKEGFRLDAVIAPTACDLYETDELSALGITFIDQPKKIRSLMMDMRAYSGVFCPSMSRNFASKLALGITDNTVLNLALTALAQGMPVYASTDGMAPTGCVACGNNVPGIQEILRNYQRQLEKMGMKLYPAADAVEKFHQTVTNKVESRDEKIITHLITAEEAGKLPGPVVKVIRGGLVTPLALEILKAKGIEVMIVPQS